MTGNPFKRETLTQEQSQDGRVLGEHDDGLHNSQGVEVLGVLGSGGMGVVHEGRQLGLARQVALKSVLEDGSIQKQRELIAEARVLALLEHPNIVPIYTLRHIHGRPTIVFKKIVGERWSDRLHEEAFEWNVEILLKVVDAIRFAHSQGIVHRDLKPSNVMIGAFGEVYVLDWGSAVSTREEHRGRIPLAISVHKPFGSAPYMAPEMLNPAWARIAETTDVYLLGAILYELVMGDPPHLDSCKYEMYRNAECSQPRFRRDMPTELVALLQRAMRREPRQRFQTVEAFKTALLGFMKHRASCDLLTRGQLLLEALKVQVPSSRDERVHGIYRRCKFTLQESLRTWPENAEAQAALEECGTVIANYELCRGEPASAAMLLEELGLMDSTQQKRIVRALQQKRKQAAHAAYLRNDADVRVAAQTRLAVMVGIGLLWVVVPLWLMAALSETSYRSQSVAHVGFLGVCGLIGLVASEWADSSATNRGLFKIVLCGGISAVAVNLGSWMMFVAPEQAQVYHLFVFFVCALTTMVTIDWRVWPTTIAFLLAYLMAARSPELCLFAMSAANAVMAANAYFIWRAAPAKRGQSIASSGEGRASGPTSLG